MGRLRQADLTRDREPDDRPPICPACGVTMGILTDRDGVVRFVCLECGFADDGATDTA
jgi:predicted RNA-binding Zn-ribbon protein involved in translation (DUF1610 family)